MKYQITIELPAKPIPGDKSHIAALIANDPRIIKEVKEIE